MNGNLIDPASPALSIVDHGITVGDGVFETVKVVNGVPFALTRHLNRLAASSSGLGLPEPDLDQVRRAVVTTLGEDTFAFGIVRITYTAGLGPLGSSRAEDGHPTLIVAVTEMQPKPTTGAVAVVPWTRNEHGALTGLKTTSYAENVRALAYAAERGCGEAIFANTAGMLCEGTGTNVFCVFGGEIVTPPLTAGCLAGVSRALAIEWCGAAERGISMEEFAGADEVFLTSTTRNVQAVDRVDDRALPAPGPVTSEVMRKWSAHEAANTDP